jgi:DNA-binding GntR family transcriptional regulator
MNFKEATDRLLDRISHEALAKRLGVSVASIRQARLSQSAKAFRSAPPEWEKAIIELANQQIADLQKLVARLEKESH